MLLPGQAGAQCSASHDGHDTVLSVHDWLRATLSSILLDYYAPGSIRLTGGSQTAPAAAVPQMEGYKADTFVGEASTVFQVRLRSWGQLGGPAWAPHAQRALRRTRPDCDTVIVQ